MDKHTSNSSAYKIGLLLVTSLLATTIVVPVNAQDRITWQSFEDAISVARKTGKPILVDIWAPWCGWCRKMKKETYPALKTELANSYVLTRLNRDDNKTLIQYKDQQLTPLRLAQKLNARTVPTVVLLSSEGDYLLHITGFLKEESLKPILKYISKEAYKKYSYESYLQRSSEF